MSYVLINLSEPSDFFMYIVFNIKELYVLLTDCISVIITYFRMVITSPQSSVANTFLLKDPFWFHKITMDPHILLT
jgi:hypothetical protein